MIQRLRYGTNIPGKPFRTEGGGWRRVDTYRPDAPQVYLGGRVESEIRESRFCAGPDDATEPHRTGDRYDSRCGSCYLNHSHTVARHEQSIAAHVSAEESRR